jgi:predicted nuclease with TOPRIM domain
MRDSHAKIKELESRLVREKQALSSLKSERSSLERDIASRQNRIRRLTDDLERVKKTSDKVVVSEHAILRYLERVEGLDIEDVKRKMVSNSAEKQIKNLGSGIFPVGASHKLRVRKGYVVTVLTEDIHPKSVKKGKAN